MEETASGVLLGIVCSIVLGLMTFLLTWNAGMALTTPVSLLIVLCFAAVVGSGRSDSAKEGEHGSCISDWVVHHDDERLGWWLDLFDDCFSGRRLASKFEPSFCYPSVNFGRIFGYSG